MPITYNILICEDDALHEQYLLEQVQSLAYAQQLDIATAAGAQQLVEQLKQQKTHILLIDIELGEDNGIELVKYLHIIDPKLQIIYVSGHLEYFSRVYETEHCWFLLKPVEKSQLDKALQRAMAKLNAEAEIKIPIKCNGAIELVAQEDVFYIESQGRKSHIYLEHSRLDTYTSLSELSRLLGQSFLRCHKSYIVNLDKVSRLTRDGFLLNNEVDVPISQSYYRQTKDQFFDYVGGAL